jgi:hypothetical protein
MSVTPEELMQQLAELTTTVKEHAGDRATIDMDKLKEELAGIMANAQVLRRGETQPTGDLVGPLGAQAVDPIIREGKYAGYRQSDLDFTVRFLRRASAIGMGAAVKPPSEMLLKAMTSTGAATGDELVPTGMSAQLWSDFFTSSRVVSTIGTIPMPTDPFDVPLNLGAITWRKGTQNTATTATTPGTYKSTLTSTEQIAEVDWSYTLDEDAVLAMLPLLKQHLGQSGGEQMDAFLLNADATDAGTGNINLDDADPAADTYYLTDGQDGMRHQALVDNTAMTINAGGDALADPDIRSAFAAMGKYAVTPGQTVLFPDLSTYLVGLLGLDGVQTLDKYGSAAVLLTGELGRYLGAPIVPSASMPLCEADGKVSTTAGNNTLGSLLIANRTMWTVGFKRQLMVEVARDIQKRQFIMVVSYRLAVASWGTRATNTHTAIIRNVKVA